MAKYASLNEHDADYLEEHTNRLNRRLHLFGSTLGLIALTYAVVAWVVWPLPAALIVGYGCTWIGISFSKGARRRRRLTHCTA